MVVRTVPEYVDGEEGTSMGNVNLFPRNQGLDSTGKNQGLGSVEGNQEITQRDKGGKLTFSNKKDVGEQVNKSVPNNTEITVIDNKKRRTNDGPGQQFEMDKNNELLLGSMEDTLEEMEQDSIQNPSVQMDPKNEEKAGSGGRVRLVQ